VHLSFFIYVSIDIHIHFSQISLNEQSLWWMLCLIGTLLHCLSATACGLIDQGFYLGVAVHKNSKLPFTCKQLLPSFSSSMVLATLYFKGRVHLAIYVGNTLVALDSTRHYYGKIMF